MMDASHGFTTGAIVQNAKPRLNESTSTEGAAAKGYNLNMEQPGSPNQPRASDLPLEALRPIPAGSESENMMLVSPSFDILMLHPAFEALWQRPTSTFLGRKCYREIEKRDEPCPHCPGVIALKTGSVTEVETCAVLDDGNRVPFLLRAFPIYGVDGEPAGFVENCENISERRRGEDEARFEADLYGRLLATSSTHRVLALGLNAALRLEGARTGCALAVDTRTGTRELVAENRFSAAEVEALDPPIVSTVVAVPEADSLLIRTPVFCHGHPAAELAIRFSTQARVWPDCRLKLEALAAVLAAALTRIEAEHLRGDAGTNIETMVRILPLPALFIDRNGGVTGWNRGAERLFGWSPRDVVGNSAPFIRSGDEERFMALVSEYSATIPPRSFLFECLHQDGHLSHASFHAGPMKDILGDGTSHLLIVSTPDLRESAWPQGGVSNRAVAAQPVRSYGIESQVSAAAHAFAELLGRVCQSMTHPADQSALLDQPSGGPGLPKGTVCAAWTEDGSLDLHVTLPSASAAARAQAPVRVLAIQNDEEQGRNLDRVLTDLGCSTVICMSAESALEHMRASSRRGDPPDLAVVEMVMHEGSGGVETARLLRAVQPTLPVVVSSDTVIVGHVAHGFAAAIRRPYDEESVRSTMERVVREAAG